MTGREAMADGRLVVASGVGEFADLGHRRGAHPVPGPPALRAQLGAAARHRARAAWSAEIAAEHLIAVDAGREVRSR
jgi:hypothetical protein